MKTPKTLSHYDIKSNINPIDKEINSNNETEIFPQKISSVKQSPSSIDDKHLHKSANTIIKFLKKSIAAQSYSKMFSQGENFKYLNLAIDAPLGARSSFQSINHLDMVSKHYISEIIEKLHPLSSDECHLLSTIINSEFNFRHQTNSNLSNKTLTIKSLNKIQSENICTHKNTFSDDIKKIANHDFVFFGVEISNHKEKLPLNKTHHAVDFGANAYIIDHESPYGYMTLTDHFDNIIPHSFHHEHISFFSDNFKEVVNEVRRYVHGNNGKADVPIFSTKDMRLGIGLHLIDFLRKSKDQRFKDFCYSKNIDPVSLDRVINFVFQPEYHIPRMLSTDNFIKIKLRKISLEEAIKASNYEEINLQVTDKKMACHALIFSIAHAKDDIAFYILSKFNFSKEDIVEMDKMGENMYYDMYDIEYLLSRKNASHKILEYFINQKLVDVNNKFKKVNRGETMLDNAVKYNNIEMIELLLKYGAASKKIE
ncbi:T3SS effector OspC family protein [Escherichia coli]|uniref:T3SS effector OspC family protein n=1 Tax=Escherichia coli TaxID=562 RepID=UPI00278BD87D|nr:T3SS effector OspC family protein [Escherichia coli]